LDLRTQAFAIRAFAVHHLGGCAMNGDLQRPDGATPQASLPVRLALLVAGTTLPLIIFAAGIVLHSYIQERAEATQHVLETVRGLRLVLDAKIQRMTGGLQVLALTDRLGDGDFEGFRDIALGFLEQYGKDGVILVADREGSQLFSSVTSDTASLPLRNNREIVTRVFASKKPQYSNLFLGAVKKTMIVTVEVPVFRDGEVIYDISFSPPIAVFQSIFEKQRPSEDWTLSLLDESGIVFARVPNPEATVGKRAAPSILDAMLRQPEAILPTVSLEGVPLMSAFAHSSITGWIIGAGISEQSLVAPLWRNLAITSLIGIVLLLVGLSFALRMATTIARGETLQNLLVEELNHRVKNTLAILQAIAVQTFRTASKVERDKFEGRLGALAEAHNLLSREKWQGSDLSDVVSRVLQPYLMTSTDRIKVSGPKVPLAPRRAVVLSMILHEIATNAAKYGALSNDTGCVTLDREVLHEGAAAAPDLERDRRSSGHRPRAARFWLTTDRAQRTRPARRRGNRRLPAARGGLYRNRVARRDAPRHQLAKTLQRGKCLQQPDADGGHRAGEKTDAGDDHQDAHRPFDVDEMALHPREHRGKLLDHEGRDQERDAEPGGVNREQAGALGDGRLRRGDRQDRRQDRPDAGCPAEREGQPHDIGAPQPDGPRDRQPPVPHQQRDPRQPEEVQPHDHDHDAGDDGELSRPGADQSPDQRGAGAEHHEHGRKTQHEQRRRGHHSASGGRDVLVIFDVLDRGTGQIDQIRRDQRQHARRQETDQAGDQRCRDRDVLNHRFIAMSSRAGPCPDGPISVALM
jgi:two-component sensor histidine kinase